MVIAICVAAFVFLLGIVLLSGKGAFLIAGYNTMSPQEKANYNEKALCRFVGGLLIIMSVCSLLAILGDYFHMAWLIGVSIAAMLILITLAVIYANTGNRFKK